MNATLALGLLASLGLGLWGMAIWLFGGAQKDEMAERSSEEPLEEGFVALRVKFNRTFARTPLGGRMEKSIRSAALPFGAADFALVALIVGLIVYLLTELIIPKFISLLLALGVMRLMWAWVNRKKRQREQLFLDQLADVARVLSNAASAGLSTSAAIAIGGRELADPAAAELRLVAQKLGIGDTLERALRGMRRRVPSEEAGVLISTLVIQQKTGGDSVKALSDISMSLDERRDLKREVRTILSGTLAVAYLVPVLGYLLIPFSEVLRRGSARDMLSSPTGLLGIAIASLFFGFGLWLVRRITRIPGEADAARQAEIRLRKEEEQDAANAPQLLERRLFEPARARTA